MIDEKDLPGGWKVFTLGKVCKLKNGFAFKSTDYVKDGVPVIRISDIKEGIVTSKKSVKVYPNSEYQNYLIANNDILVAMSGATTGKFGIFRSHEIAYQNQRVGKFQILDSKVLNNEFLLYQLHSLKRQIEKDAYGGAQPNISSTKIEQMEIVVPSLNQQQAIVAKIEELFSELDKGIENLKTAQKQLKVYRQAVLKSAFEGRLTNDNVEDDELPKSWKWIKLREVCDKIQDGSHFSPQVQYDDPGENRYMYITAKNIRNNYMDFRKLYYVDEEYHNSIYQRCNPEYGDVLLTKDGINTGEVTLNTLKEPISLLSSVCLFKPQKGVLKAELLKYFIQSPFGNQMILQSMTGTAIKRIVLGKIKDAKISLPTFEEQAEIISEIENRLSVCDNIEESIVVSLKQAEVLRQSILKKAFEGKLVKAEVQVGIAKVISINTVTNGDNWQRKVLAGKIISSFQRGGYIGRTKFQKILYLCETYAQLDYDTAYIKEAAGPLDSKFLYSFIEEGKQKNWIEETHEGNWYKYEPGEAISDLITDYPKFFRAKSDKIQFVIKQLHDLDTDTCELVATIYAIWNNFFIENRTLTADVLINEVYEWDDSKAKFAKPQILSKWNWMKSVELVPIGFGKLIGK